MKMLSGKSFLIILLMGMVAFGMEAEADYYRGGGRFVRHPHHHPGFSFYWGTPWYPGRLYYPFDPYFYPPAVITVPVTPPVYIEQSKPSLPTGYWYYCTNPEGYYPYIKECPTGWQQVAPIPPQ